LSIVVKYSYIGVYILMLLESVIFVIPSEVVMGLVGFLASQGFFNIYIAILIGALGNMTGSLILYYLSKVGRIYVLSIFDKNIDKKVDRAIDLFKRFDKWAVALAQFIPGIRTLISVPAGLAGMNLVMFLTITYIGGALWYGILGYAGYMLGANWQVILEFVKAYTYLVLGALALIVGILGAVYYSYIYKKARAAKAA